MQKCCLVGCDNESLKGISDYCDYHYSEKNKAYFQAVDDALVCWEMTTTGNAKVDLNNLVCMEQQVCLDPAVSLDARILIRLGRVEAAREIIQYIVDQGKLSVPRTGEEVYFVVDEDLKEIKEKFGLEI